MKNKTTLLSKIKLMSAFLIIGMIFISAQGFASISIIPTPISSIQKTTDDEWKVLIDKNEISIYYTEVKDNPCIGYKLKIVNHTTQKYTISFGIAAKLTDNCKGEYKTFNEFQVRKIEIMPNSITIGDENTPMLLLPTTTLSVKDLIQNLSIQ